MHLLSLVLKEEQNIKRYPAFVLDRERPNSLQIKNRRKRNHDEKWSYL